MSKKTTKKVADAVRSALTTGKSVLDTLPPDMLIRGLIRDGIRIAVIVTVLDGTRLFWGDTDELIAIANLLLDQQAVLSFQVFDFEVNSRELKPSERQRYQ